MLCCLYTQSLTLLAHEATNSSSAAGERCSSKARFASFTCKLGCAAKASPHRNQRYYFALLSSALLCLRRGWLRCIVSMLTLLRIPTELLLMDLLPLEVTSHRPIATERVTKCSTTRQKTRALILDRLPGGGDDFHEQRSNHESGIDLLSTRRPLASTPASQTACLHALFCKTNMCRPYIHVATHRHTQSLPDICWRIPYSPRLFPAPTS
jgi:hypothetical protein